ncbi:hypothetical protein BH10CYA1_BH10CYA1_24030 [soil metagenome]
MDDDQAGFVLLIEIKKMVEAARIALASKEA